MSSLMISDGPDAHLWTVVRWHPVDEALPDEYDAVIVCVGGWHSVSTARLTCRGWEYLDGSALLNVRFWCEFPDAPT